jgi:hypothetical protein
LIEAAMAEPGGQLRQRAIDSVVMGSVYLYCTPHVRASGAIKVKTVAVNAAFDQGCWRRRPRGSQRAAASSFAPIARAPSSGGVVMGTRSGDLDPLAQDADKNAKRHDRQDR